MEPKGLNVLLELVILWQEKLILDPKAERKKDSSCYLGLAEQIQRLFTARVLSLFLAIECKVMTSKGSKPLHPLWEIGG